MSKFSAAPVLLATGMLACAFQLQAASVTTFADPDNSATGTTDQGCLQGLTYFVSEKENCMYDGGETAYEDPPGTKSQNPSGESTGPFSQGTYYDYSTDPYTYDVTSGPFGYTPFPGDAKMAPIINGPITIDDKGDGFGANDEISFTLTLTMGTGGDIVRHLGRNVGDKYASMTQVLAPRTADFVTANAFGGFDYVIGSEGFPVLLTFIDASANESSAGAGDGPCVGQTFGDMECDASFDINGNTDPLRWAPWTPKDLGIVAGQPGAPLPHDGPPASPGIGSLEGNIGAHTSGSVTGFSCIDDGTTPAGAPAGSTYCTAGKTSFAPLLVGPNQTPAGGTAAEDVDWDQVYLKVSTDEFGNVLSAEGFYAQEYFVFGPGNGTIGLCGSDAGATYACNTWLAGHFNITGDVPVALDDTGVTTVVDAPINIDVLANDIGFDDPVTVSLPGSGVSASGGTVVINGPNPGPQAGIDVTYTPALGFSGIDSFDYVVDDGNAGSATVTVEVLNLGANDDNASTRLNTTRTGIPVGANDFGFADPVTVTITVPPDMGGSVDAINGSGGPAADVTIDFTPMAAVGTATYTETFTYEVTDADMVTDTAVVRVTVNNRVPAAVDADASAAEGAAAVTDIAALAGVELGDPPSVITEESAPANGTTAVAGNVITYTPTGFFTGTDSYDYKIADADGEESIATVSVTIGPKRVPTANPDAATVDQDSNVQIDVTANDVAGSGALAAHTVTVSSNPANGAAAVGAGNVVTYTPAAGFSGGDGFQYTLNDADGDPSVTTVSVTVNATAPPPALKPDVPELPSANALDPWSLALLPLAPWIRRRRKPASR